MVLFVKLFASEVEGGEDVEKEQKELYFRPILCSEGFEGKVFIIDLKREPWPLHCSCIPLILVKVLERFSLFLGDVVELRSVIQFCFYIRLSEGSSSLSQRIPPEVSVFSRKTSLVPSKLINICSFLTLCLPAYLLFYLVALRDAKYDFLVTMVSSSGLR